MEACYVCREVDERSELYERWLFAENFGDGATLESVASSRGYCTFHAARVVRRDPNIAGPIATFTLRVIEAELRRQIADRHGYRNALDRRTQCPWCQTEVEATEYALSAGRTASASLCQPHAQVASQGGGHRLNADSPLRLGAPLANPYSIEAPPPSWWSSCVTALAADLRAADCPACASATQASADREAFYRAGSRPHEHWETPRLCRAHDVQLGQRRDADFRRSPDGLDRSCDWCSVMKRAAQRTVELFVLAYGEPAFRFAYASVPGLCLPHAAAALERARGNAKEEFAAATLTRIATMVWELEERAMRRAWQLRDQGELRDASTLSHRAWWLAAGGTFRFSAG